MLLKNTVFKDFVLKKDSFGQKIKKHFREAMADRTRRLVFILGCIAAAALCVLVVITVTRAEKTLFEADLSSGAYDGFGTDAYYPDLSVFGVAKDDLYGECFMIENTEENDARFTYRTRLSAGKIYKIEADIKTDIDSSGRYGANLSVLEAGSGGFGMLRGQNGWTHVEEYISVARTDTYTVCLRLGYYSGTVAGKAWFDNLKIARVPGVPSGRTAVKAGKTVETVTEGAQYNQLLYEDMRVVSFMILAAVLLVFVIRYLYQRAYDRAGSGGFIADDGEPVRIGKLRRLLKAAGDRENEPFRTLPDPFAVIAALFLFALAVRLVLSVSYFQCNIDVGLFKSWGRTVLSSGISKLYVESPSCDYPPLYLYFLGGSALASKLLGFGDAGFTMLVKLPSILADIAIGAIIFRTAVRKRFTFGNCTFFTALWLFNPAAILDSACWGQVDSLLALFVILTCIGINRRNYLVAGLSFGLGIMLKPQMIILLPVVGAAFLVFFISEIVRKRAKNAFAGLGLLLGGLISGLAVPCIPFFSMGFGEVELLGRTFKAPWIFTLFLGTIDHYKYATVNCYNFWFLLGKNWKNDEEIMNGLSLHSWGMLAIVLISLAAVAAFAAVLVKALKNKSGNAETFETVTFLAAAHMFACVACFGPRMHERYFFPAMALLLLGAVTSRRRGIIIPYALLSGIGFITVHEIMMGLLVGASIRGVVDNAAVFGDYYWPSLNPYRGALAFVMVAASLVTTALLAAAAVRYGGSGSEGIQNGGIQGEGARGEGAPDGETKTVTVGAGGTEPFNEESGESQAGAARTEETQAGDQAGGPVPGGTEP